jgi:tetratricopeptide (TPR) repeat protein
VLGGTLDVGLLRSTSGRSEEEVIDAADELVGRQILREVPGTGSSLGFTLHALERTVYESLSPIRRRLLHRRAADALQLSPRVERDAGVAMAVADHLRLGGREDEAADWYGRAGDLAVSLYATSEAERAYRTALAMGHPDQGEIQFALGEVLLRQSRFAEALDAFQAAAAFGDPSLVARAEHRLGDVHRRLGRFEQAEHHFGLAEEQHPTPDALFADWALLEFRQGNRQVAETRARRAVDLAVARGLPAAESRARDILGIVTESTVELERALALAGGDLEARMAALNSLAFAVAGSGDIEGAASLVEEAIEIADAVGDRHRKAALLDHLADLHHRAGREEESQDALTEAVRIFADLQPDAWEPEVWLLTRW